MKTSGISGDKLLGREEESGIRAADVILVVLCLFLLLVIFLRQFVLFPVGISGNSMYDTLSDGDVLIINKWEKVDRGDVVVVFIRKNAKGEDVNYIKRVIGLPGETVYIEYGKVYVGKNGEKRLLDESGYAYYADGSGKTLVNNSEQPVSFELGDDEVFLMGDNRRDSHDSRAADVGPRKMGDIIGVVPEWAIKRKDAIKGYYEFTGRTFGFFGKLFNDVTG